MIRLTLTLGLSLASIFITVNSNAQTTEDRSQSKTLSDLTALFEATEPNDSLAGVYLMEMINLSEQEGNYELMADLAIQLTRLPLPSVQLPEVKKKILKRAISFENNVVKSEDKGNLHLKLAGAFFNLEQFDSAIVEYTEAIHRFTDKDSIFIADSHFFRGQARDYKGDLLGGMEDYQTARDIYQALNDQEYVQYVDGGMAICSANSPYITKPKKLENH